MILKQKKKTEEEVPMMDGIEVRRKIMLLTIICF